MVQACNLALVWTKIGLGSFVSRICLLFQIFNPARNYSYFADQLTRLRLLQSFRQRLVAIDCDAHFLFVEFFKSEFVCFKSFDLFLKLTFFEGRFLQVALKLADL